MSKNILLLIVITVLVSAAVAQDGQELSAEKSPNEKLKGEHPLVALAKTKPSALKKDL